MKKIIYIRKMFYRFCIFATLFLQLLNDINASTIVNYELEKDFKINAQANANVVEQVQNKPLKWLKSAQDMISSPTGHIVIQMAKELLNRSTGSTQVLSLNVTNLIILILLKLLIVTAALLGAGHWRSHSYDYGRSAEPTISLNDAEADLITGFLAAQSGYDDCLYVAACSNPHMAEQYVKAAKALIGGVEKFERSTLNNPRYYDLIQVVEQAAYNGYHHLPCNTIKTCEHLM